MMTATVTQEGKFLKVITNTGKDISNQIERPMRKKAVALGKQLEFDDVKNVWKISGEAAPTVKNVAAPTAKAMDKLEASLLAEPVKAKRSRPERIVRVMEKPTIPLGTVVPVDFIGKIYDVTLTELKPNPNHINRWIYGGTSTCSRKLRIPFIGIDGTEQFANIITSKMQTVKEKVKVTKEKKTKKAKA